MLQILRCHLAFQAQPPLVLRPHCAVLGTQQMKKQDARCKENH